MHINQYTLPPFGSPFSQIEWSSTTRDAYGNLLFTGNSVVSSTQAAILTAKFSPTCDSIWQKTWLAANDGNPSTSFGIAVTTDASGHVYVAGATAIGLAPGQEQFDYIVLKYDGSGDLLWATGYDGTAGGADFPTALISDGSGNLFVTGISKGIDSGFDYLTLKLATSNGSILWQKRYDEAGSDDFAVAIELDGPGNPVVAGAAGTDSLQQAANTLKYQASDGTLQAQDQFQEAGTDLKMAKAFTKDAEGNFYLALHSNPTGNNQNIQILKLDDGLNPLWSYTYNNNGKEDGANDISLGAGGQVFVTGYSQDNHGRYELLVLSLKQDSSFLWERHFRPADPLEQVVGKKCVMALDSNLYVSGDLICPDSSVVLTLKFDSEGNILWQDKFSSGEKLNKTMNIVTGLDKNLFVFGVAGSTEKSSYFRLRYKEFEREGGVVTDTVTGAKYRPAELIVKFRGDALNHDRVNQLYITHEHPSWFLTQAAYDTLNARINLERATLVRIFRQLKTTYTTTVSRLGHTVNVPDFWAAFILVLPQAGDIPSTIQLLESTFPLVVYAHPNYLIELACVPDDNMYAAQHSLHPTGQYTADLDINIETVWCEFEVYGEPSVKVGVFDSGIYWDHIDFGAGVVGVPGSSVVKGGYEVKTGTALLSLPVPDNSSVSHGTSIAGIIGAVRDNGWGVAGIAGGHGNDKLSPGGNGVSLYGMMVTPPHDHGEVANVSDAIFTTSVEDNDMEHAYGLHISQHAWISSPANVEETIQLLSNAVRFSNELQVVFVSARGNNGNDAPSYPGTYDDDWVISVGASGLNGDYAGGEWSPFPGPSYGLGMDLIAPGTFPLIRSVSKDGTWMNTPHGTSYASPHVAGVAALLLNYHNGAVTDSYENLAPEDVEFILEKTAKDVGPSGWDVQNGSGRLDAGAAFELIRKPDRLVRHFGTMHYPSTVTSDLVAEDVEIVFTETYENKSGVAFQKGVVYHADVHKLSAVVQHNIDPQWTIEEQWERHSFSTTFPNYDETSGSLIPHEKVKLINLGQDEAILEGYIYEVKVSSTNETLGWAPFSLEDVAAKGIFEYSLLLAKEPITPANEVKPGFVFDIYPNPTSGETTFHIELYDMTELEVALYNCNGLNVLSVFRGKAGPGTMKQTLDLSGLPAGYYLMRAINPYGLSIQPIVKF